LATFIYKKYKNKKLERQLNYEYFNSRVSMEVERRMYGADGS